jgi:hypothetical protein
MIVSWRGRNVDTLSHEEAITELKVVLGLYKQALEWEREARMMWWLPRPNAET